MRVAVLYNEDTGLARGRPEDGVAVRAVALAAAAVADACRRGAWEAMEVPAPDEPLELLAALDRLRPDVVFNLVESLRGEARLEAAVAALLELSGLPFTGCDALACALSLDKPMARDVLRAAGVPVPAGRVLERGDEALDGLRPPLIVKPSREDGSHGIGRDSVAADEAAARARAREVLACYGQPALVEEFVTGREFNVSLLGEGAAAEVLPLAEIDYSALPPGHPPLLTYEAKWNETSAAYRRTPSVPARELEPALDRAIRKAALAAYRALRLRDYGRVDLRLHPERGPLVLEVNANPDLSPGAGLARAAASGGIPYDDLVCRIVHAARARSGRPAPAPAAAR